MRPELALCLLAALACRAAPPAPTPAPFTLGATLRADRGADLPAAAYTRVVWLATLDCAWYEAFDATSGSPLSSAARHVFARGAEPPLKPRGELALGGRWLGEAGARPEAAPSWSERRMAALHDGAVLGFTLAPADLGPEGPRTPWREAALELVRAPSGSELTLVLSGRDDGQLERVRLDARLAPGSAGVRWSLPAPRAEAPEGALVFELSIGTLPGDAERAAAERAFDAALQRGRGLARPLSEGEAARLERARALGALGDPARRRASLFFLADTCGARLAADVALLGDDALLAACADALAQAWDGADDLDAPAFGWAVEAAAARTLLARDAPDPEAESVPLAPELRAVLLERCGELALYPDLLGACVDGSADLAAFEARLRAENRFFLEDADPAARVRAYDWLVARDAAPADYDPLGERDARRAALDAAREEAP